MDSLPVIDVAALIEPGGDATEAAARIDAACREHGFFYVVGHGIDDELQADLEEQARAFFDLPEAAKAKVAMAQGGPAWRGWFPVGGELTSGRPDNKEGLYLGAELDAGHPLVRSGTPMHGPNLFPSEVPGLRTAVLAHLDAMTELGHALMRGFALGLGLDPSWFDDNLTADPLVLFRIFRYPPQAPADEESWGVAEHTDYGLLTILRQDGPGLEVHAPSGWIDAPPLPGSFVCNVGDMLERVTSGRYRSTPHRVRNRSDGDRLSFPFFFDPSWDAQVVPVPTSDAARPRAVRDRWDGEDLFAFDGTYGDYLLAKVGKVFPELRAEVLDREV